MLRLTKKLQLSAIYGCLHNFGPTKNEGDQIVDNLYLVNKVDNSQNFNHLSQKARRKRAKWVNKK